jgi:hypothetical protein
MNEIEQRILDYINQFNTEELVFLEPNSQIPISRDYHEELDTKTMIERIVFMTGMKPSYIRDEDRLTKTCDSRRWRSSLDIWRHAIYFKPDLSIFQVMYYLYDLASNDEKLSGHYCCDIYRRVFKHTGITLWYRLYGDDADEYKLSLYDWAKLKGHICTQ